MAAPRCPVCWAQTHDSICAACGTVLDPELFAITAPISPADLVAAHDSCRCGPNCDLCDAEDDADNSPGGQCYKGTCCHDDCLAQRTAHFERGMV